MSKFATIAADASRVAQGKRARTIVTVDMGRAGRQDVALVALTGAEEKAVLAGALKYAKAEGVEDPGIGDPIYDLGIQLHTLAIACIDPESPEDKPERFFASVEEIEKTDLLGRDHYAMLFEYQVLHQNSVSPFETNVTPDQIMTWAAKIAEGDHVPFVDMRPSDRWNFTRSLALRYLTLLAAKSLSSQPTGESNSTGETPNH